MAPKSKRYSKNSARNGNAGEHQASVAPTSVFGVGGSSSDARFRIQRHTAGPDFSPPFGALSGLPEGWGFTGCGRTPPSCHSEPVRCHPDPFACHSERSEESPQLAQGKLREESRQLLVDLTTAGILLPRLRDQNDRRVESVHCEKVCRIVSLTRSVQLPHSEDGTARKM